MTATDLPFTAEEYARRLDLVRAEMAARDLDALFVTDPSNMAWLTGYDGWSFYVHQGVILRPGADPLWWGRLQDSEGAYRTVWMADDHVRAYGEHFIQTPLRHPMEDLAALLGDLGLTRARIGVEMDNYYFSAKAFMTLRERLPDAALIDATVLVNWQRAVKSAEEIAFMRRAARITETMMQGALERAAAGVPKNALIAGLQSDGIIGADGHWGDYPAIVPLMPSGSDAAAPHLTWNGDPLRHGDVTTIEIAGCYRRYHVPLCRSLSIGPPSDAVRRGEAAVLEGLAEGIEAARAGNTAGDVARALFGALRRAGIERTARCGYPVGLSYPPDWGERTISLRPDDDTVLLPGMTFHFMPGLWMGDWGLAITETILIRPEGPAACFVTMPRGLAIKE
ncbi:MAG: M24 family metallopeptidase [Pseudomonadota bacterium]